ncbi:tetratricopeptide repeat protein [Streptomyces sp. NPDC056431]|uniref:tetratricopeptide repeat protein n=1 Tax=Streptomyces sp. NPDC056431 TaxID=3345814 RepID=UPI00369A8208
MSGGVEASGERSVAAGRDIGWVHTGDRVTVLQPAALGPVLCPPGLVDVPRRAAHFVGRDAEGAVLDGESETVVICGLGGVGKSSLAARWALRQTADRNPVWWITAESWADVEAGLAGLAAAMQPELIDVLPQEALRERALQWLSAHDGWLLVLDNVTDPADVEGLLARAGGRGRVVVTSRTTDGWYGIGRVLVLPVLAAGEAVELFTRVATHAGPRDTTGAEGLCETLGQLPLAVEIAAAYCGRTATPPLAYLARLGTGGGPGNAEEAVARTLRVTLDRLGASDPSAGELLRLLAWFAPDRIPVPLLPSGSGVREALGELAAHSMVTLHEDGSVSVHRLVQAVARRADRQDPHREPGLIERARLAAETALVRAVPQDSMDPAHWETWRGLRPHLEAYLRCSDPGKDDGALLGTLVAAAMYLTLNALAEGAVAMYERALAGAERLVGPEHPYTVGVRGGMIVVLAETGRGAEAIRLAAGVVRDMTEEYGADHRLVFVARRCLAQAHQLSGLVGEAVALHEGVVEDMVRVLGEGDRQTLEALVELSAVYRSAYRILDAVAVCSQAEAGLAAALGADHPETLMARLNLAALYGVAGQGERSRAGFEELLPVCVRVLGEHHPITVTVAESLAELPL